MTKYRAEQMLSLSGWECGTEIDIKQVVTFSVTPYRAATLESPEEHPTVEDVECRYFVGATELHVGRHVTGKFEENDGFKTWLLSEAAEMAAYERDCSAEAKAEDARYASLPSYPEDGR